MDRISGKYPGGPSRPDGESEDPAPRRPLTRGEEYEERAQRAVVQRTQRLRRRRVALGAILVVLLAGGTGLWLGYQAHQTQEELARGGSDLRDLLNFKKEADRVLHEIWRMEELDRSIYNRQAPW